MSVHHGFRQVRRQPSVSPPIGSIIRVPEFLDQFHSSECIQRFLHDNDKHSGNPFANGKVQLLHCGDKHDVASVRKEYWFHATKLIHKFGIYIHELEFSAYYPVSSVLMTRYLIEILRYLPKLKVLHIFEGAGCIACDDDNYFENIKHKKFFKKNPIPKLPNLQELSIRGACPVFINAVLAACPLSLQALILENVSEYDDWEFPEAVFDFMNLELLHAEMSDIDFHRFTSRFSVPPIKTLRWNLNNKARFVSPRLLLVAANAFYNTLEHIKCSATFSDMDREPRPTFDLYYKLLNKVTLHLHTLQICEH